MNQNETSTAQGKQKARPSCPPIAFPLFTAPEREAEALPGFPFKARQTVMIGATARRADLFRGVE
jgi:hypothetical protein